MKLSLSTDFGSPAHWERAVDFAVKNGISRMVYWWDFSNAPYMEPCLYPKYPEIVPEAEIQKRVQMQERMRYASRLTQQAGIEFWYVFQVMMLPDYNHVYKVWPELFITPEEPDMSNDRIYEIIRDQMDEIFELAPNLAGFELWVMECAQLVIAGFRHQKISIPEICTRIFDTVYGFLKEKGLTLVQDLHTSGGDTTTLKTFQAAARQHPDVIVSADNVIGDYHLHLPFNAHIQKSAETNPVQVNFDLNGEYWGRNFIPSSALSQYAEHLEIARQMKAVHVNGRISTGHDSWSPYANILPSRRCFYPRLPEITPDKPVPSDLEVTCTDTLGAFNAEFFCARAKDPSVQPEDVVRKFLRREFGEKAVALLPQFMKLEGVLSKLFYTDKNYQGFQSVLLSPEMIGFNALGEQMICKPGEPFPSQEAKDNPGWGEWKAALAGWPIPVNHISAGPQAMISDKESAVEEATEMLVAAQSVTEELTAEDRDFLRQQFEDLLFYVKAARTLCEAQIHYFHLKYEKQQGDIPNQARLTELLEQLDTLAGEWEARYPGGRYLIAERLREWQKHIKETLQ